MMLKIITLCCVILNVQSQGLSTLNPFYSQFLNPDRIYFADNLPKSLVLPLSSKPDPDVVRQIFGSSPTQDKKKNGSPSVEIEKSNEISYSTSVEQATNRIPVQNVASRQPVPQAIPSRQTSQQNVRDVEKVQKMARRQAPDQTISNQTTEKSSQNVPPVQSPPAASGSGFNSLLYSVTNFGINLLKNVHTIQPGNVVLSPYSITSLLALLQQGAVGQTQEQITTALQMMPATSASSYYQLSEDLKKRNSRNILKTANNVFIADGFSINPDFKKIAQSNFYSDITPLSFNRPDLAARQINSWVASRTDHKIEKLVSPDAFDASTQMVLVNAVYFKGLWDVPFRVESTLPRDFLLSNGETKTAQYMRIRKLFRTGMDPATNAKVIILPFELDQYSLMVILPSQLVGMSRTLSTMTDARLLSYLSFPAVDTELELPRFTVRADTDLNTVLRTMGITNMFGPYAELNRLGLYRAYSPQISEAVHSAVLSIDEQGGSAAAATAFAAVALSYDEPSAVFKANRPFLAVLWDTKTSLPIFMAKIEDPQQ